MSSVFFSLCKVRNCWANSKQKPPNRGVFVLPLFPSCARSPTTCSDRREEQVRTLRFRLRNDGVKPSSKFAAEGAGDRSLSLGSSPTNVFGCRPFRFAPVRIADTACKAILVHNSSNSSFCYGNTAFANNNSDSTDTVSLIAFVINLLKSI